MKTNVSYVMVLAVGAGVYACGGSTSASNPGTDAGTSMTVLDSGTAAETSTPHDSGTTAHDAGATDATAEAEAGLDHGGPSTTYPAFLPSVGQVQNNMGLVMTHPIIVPITWPTDPSEASFQSFVDTIGGTSYWTATTSEYGVGAAVSGAHISMSTAAPGSMADADFQNLVTANAGAAGPWPVATDNTIYAFFLDPMTKLNMGTGSPDACAAGVGGYHSQVTVGSVTTSYAIVPSCTFGGTNTAAQQSTMSMSHELIEAVTDPQPMNMGAVGYTGFDQEHFAYDWMLEFSSELGDACELEHASFYEEKETTPAAFDYWVQRTWSNKAGPLGHNPCVPQGTDPYFNVAILNLAETTITLPPQLTGGSTPQNVQVKGVKIPVGQSALVELGFFSDAATSGPWTVTWNQGSPFNPTKQTYLNVTIDQPTGVNGDKAYATVTPNAEGKLAAELLWFKSTLGSVSHIMPVVISSYVSD